SSNQTITVTAIAAGVTANATLTVSGGLGISNVFTPIRVNAGGPAYTDSLNQAWSADYSFSGGSPWSTAAAVASNSSAAVYQTCRYGAFAYAFSAPNGSYTVKLKFAEPSLNGPGQRLFNVAINGSTVLTNFDVYAAGGAMM